MQQAAILELGDLGLEATSRRAGAVAGGGAAANGEVRKWNGLADYIASLGPKQKVKAKGWALKNPRLIFPVFRVFSLTPLPLFHTK